MLDAQLVNRIREYVAAEMQPRGQSLGDLLRAAQQQHAGRGTIQSTMAAQSYAIVARDELSVRAGRIWNAIRRSHESLAGEYSEYLLEDLRQQLAEHLSRESGAVAGPAVALAKWNPRCEAIVRDQMTARTRELVAKFDVEAQFYVDQLKRRASTPSAAPVVNIHGPVGAVQTGSYATAHVTFSGPDRDRLVEALEKLRDAMERNDEIDLTQREQSTELIADVIAATKSEKPNALKVAGLLNALAQTVQTFASLFPAWEVVKDAAIAVGFPLS